MYTNLILIWIALALLLMPLQFRIAAPYGRHISTKWGPLVNARLGWLVMEIMAPLAFLWFFVQTEKTHLITLILAGSFLAHYIHRSVIYPFRLRSSSRTMPVVVVLMAIVFNVINGGLNGSFLAANPDYYLPAEEHWFRLGLGGVLFLGGAIVNIYHDNILIGLREGDSDTSYTIPKGGLFRFVSCPNHFGEMVEWAGFAIMCWNLPAVAFFVWTASNLVPRAWHHHMWYHRHFSDYPNNRKAVIPFVL